MGRLVVLTWFALSVLLVLKTAHTPGGWILSTDDAMRLVQVRDLLNGQSWFDTTQWRMNAPYGLPMHWSRLVDAGIASLILLFRLFTDAKTAETWTLYVWPLLPLLPVLLALTHIGYRLVGRTGALLALALGASCVAARGPFEPGNIDHHNVQLALSIGFIAFLMDIDRSRRAAIFAAITAAVSLAVGLETLPYFVAALIALAIWWCFDGRISANVAAFGGTLAATSVLLLGGVTASAYRISSACDTFSGLYATLVALSGMGAALLAMQPRLDSPLRRGAAAAGLCTLVIVVAALLGPACLHGPYAHVDPRLWQVWLSGVDEVQSPFTMGLMAPGDFVGGYFYCVLAIIALVAAVFVVRPQHRPPMVILCAVALVAFAIATTQLRALAFAVLFATPGMAVVASRLLERLPISRTASLLATLAAVLFSSDASYAFIGERIQKSLPLSQQYTPVQEKWVRACMVPAAFGELAALPRGRVAAFVDMGPMIIASTPHATLGGPYHRNAAGILNTYTIFAGSALEQRATLLKRGVDYVAICTPEPDYVLWGAVARRDSLLKVDSKGGMEPWLEPLVTHPHGGEVRIFRVRRDRLS